MLILSKKKFLSFGWTASGQRLKNSLLDGIYGISSLLLKKQ